ncbi:hypothetical protein HS088_TW09G00938 [Tripterygium wilfordii]|uniref:Uncharacterized protein n=1 Tax=Tripterygium wilfordii TaxID=458696 RepID=A0A7J7D9X0_TRIWF|nr:hypothetical protein HS088_TW09G00938 [Tripterygium wilfordii]
MSNQNELAVFDVDETLSWLIIIRGQTVFLGGDLYIGLCYFGVFNLSYDAIEFLVELGTKLFFIFYFVDSFSFHLYTTNLMIMLFKMQSVYDNYASKDLVLSFWLL